MQAILILAHYGEKFEQHHDSIRSAVESIQSNILNNTAAPVQLIVEPMTMGQITFNAKQCYALRYILEEDDGK